MTLAELIDLYPDLCSIKERMLLVGPELFPSLHGRAIQECRMFVLIAEGSITLRTSTDILRIDAPSYIDMLVWEPIEILDTTPQVQAWCLLPNYMFTNEALNGLRSADSELFKSLHAVPVNRLTPHDALQLQQHLRLLQSALLRDKHTYRRELCQSYFRIFMLEARDMLRRKETEATAAVESRKDTIVRSFLKLVWSNYRTHHNVDFYADKLCLSTKHLTRVVRTSMGKTPYVVIRDEILQHAASLLRNTKMSVQEISADLNFSEMAAFCKFFKKHQGQSPTAYRKSQT